MPRINLLKAWCFSAFLFLTLSATVSQAQYAWKTDTVCRSCRPLKAAFSDSMNGAVISGVARSYEGRISVTTDGGLHWKTTAPFARPSARRFDDFSAGGPGMFHLWEQGSVLYSVDSGNSWQANRVVPYPLAAKYFSKTEGVGIVLNPQSGEFPEYYSVNIPEGTEWWYTQLNTFTDSIPPVQGVFRSVTEFALFQMTLTKSVVRITQDSGRSWIRSELFNSVDSTYPFYITDNAEENIRIVHSLGKYMFALTSDDGEHWLKVADNSSRTIARLMWQRGLWGLKGTRNDYLSDDLLSPEPANAFATQVVTSSDLGSTWQTVDIGLDSVQYFSMFEGPNGKPCFLSWKDSTVLFTAYRNTSVVQRAPAITRKLALFPNPLVSSNTISVETSQSGTVRVIVTDVLERAVYTTKLDAIDGMPAAMQLPDLLPGAYTLTVVSPDGTVELGRFLKL